MFKKIDYYFLLAAFASLVASVALWFLGGERRDSGVRDSGVYVGLWVPSILALWVGVRVALLTRIVTNQNRRN